MEFVELGPIANFEVFLIFHGFCLSSFLQPCGLVCSMRVVCVYVVCVCGIVCAVSAGC